MNALVPPPCPECSVTLRYDNDGPPLHGTFTCAACDYVSAGWRDVPNGQLVLSDAVDLFIKRDGAR